MINTLPVDAKRVLNTLKGAQPCCKCLFLQRGRRPWLPDAAAEMIFSCPQGVVLVVTFNGAGTSTEEFQRRPLMQLTVFVRKSRCVTSSAQVIECESDLN